MKRRQLFSFLFVDCFQVRPHLKQEYLKKPQTNSKVLKSITIVCVFIKFQPQVKTLKSKQDVVKDLQHLGKSTVLLYFKSWINYFKTALMEQLKLHHIHTQILSISHKQNERTMHKRMEKKLSISSFHWPDHKRNCLFF